MSWEYNTLDRRSSMIAVGGLVVLALLMSRSDREGIGLERLSAAKEVVAEEVTYDGGISFSCPVNPSDERPMARTLGQTYCEVHWHGSKPDQKCPVTVTIDDQRFISDDLQYENFLKRGAKSGEEELKKVGVRMDSGAMPTIANYTSSASNLTMLCLYDEKKRLLGMRVFPAEETSEARPAWPEKRFHVSTPMGTVMLPADYTLLVARLGKPLKHEEGRLVKPPDDDDEE